MKRIKGFITQEFAANTVEPLSMVAAMVVKDCAREGIEPIGTLEGKLAYMDRDFIEGKPQVCVFTFTLENQ